MYVIIYSNIVYTLIGNIEAVNCINTSRIATYCVSCLQLLISKVKVIIVRNGMIYGFSIRGVTIVQ